MSHVNARLNGTIATVLNIQTGGDMKILNVAEKNDAAKGIAGYLSHGASRRREGLSVYNKIYEFEAQVFGQQCKMIMTSVSGHILNRTFIGQYSNWQSCNPIALFDAPIVKRCEENFIKIKKTLEREIKTCGVLIIWTDCDREGENIGFDVMQICQAVKQNIQVYRATFSEITQQSVTRALHNLGAPNKAISDAVNVRSELDLRIGAAFTRFQTMRLRQVFPRNLGDMMISYGSCQFPTLGFVVERFLAIERFVPEPFWRVRVIDTRENLSVEFKWERNRLFERLACQVLLDVCLESPDARVEKVVSKPKSKWRPLPLDTVELSKLGSRKLRLNAKETMRIAEKLYTQGFISYPRTETNIYPKELNLVLLVEQQTDNPAWGQFAQRVIDHGPHPRVGKKNDQAHPPIHPTKSTNGLAGDEARVYEFITRYFLASLSKDAEGQETIVTIDIAAEKFVATGLRIIARNYLDVYPYETWNAKEIHPYEEGDVFRPTTIDMADGETAPPNLLTEADLIALMDKHGIGTDATHAEHIEKIKSRHYVGLRDGRHFVPGKLGIGLVMGYNNMGFHMSKPNLRAELENDLKLICEGRKNPDEVLRQQVSKYREIFREALQKANLIDDALAQYLEEQPARVPDVELMDPVPEVAIFKCPKCGTDMNIKHRRNGPGKFIGCMLYPTCNNAVWFPSTVEDVQVLPETCNQCPGDMHILKFKFHQHAFPSLGTTYTSCIGGCNPIINNALNVQEQSVRRTANAATARSDSSVRSNDTGNHSNNSRLNPRSQTQVRDTNTRPQTQTRRTPSQNDSGVASWSITSTWASNENTRSNVASTQSRPDSGDDHDYMCNCHERAMPLPCVRRDRIRVRRLFYKCAKPQGQGCGFFLWGDDGTPTSNSVNRSQSQVANVTISRFRNEPETRPTPAARTWNATNPAPDDDDEVICTCGNPARKLTVNKEGPNKGRQFYGCPDGMGSTCNFFKWAEEGASGSSVPRGSGASSRGRGGRGGGGSTRAAPGNSIRRKCGICGIEGHTRRTCPQGDAEADD